MGLKPFPSYPGESEPCSTNLLESGSDEKDPLIRPGIGDSFVRLNAAGPGNSKNRDD